MLDRRLPVLDCLVSWSPARLEITCVRLSGILVSIQTGAEVPQTPAPGQLEGRNPDFPKI